MFDSIFDSGSSNSTSIHLFYYLASTQLISPTFSICLNNESRVGTPLRQCLLIYYLNFFCISGLHQELSSESSQKDSHRWETLHLLMGRLQLEICQIWWADPPLSKTHWSETIQVSPMFKIILQEWPLVLAHEKTLEMFETLKSCC